MNTKGSKYFSSTCGLFRVSWLILLSLLNQLLQAAEGRMILGLDTASGLQISYQVEPGYSYQLQETRDFVHWVNYGSPFRGTEIMSRHIPLDDSNQIAAYYRCLRNIDHGSPEEWINAQVGCNRIDPVELSSDASSLYTIIASKAFVYLTGTLEQAYHEPVGEVANYFGFAALRNEIRDQYGRLADQGIRGVSWFETLEILNSEQRRILYELVDQHEPLFDDFFKKRIDLLDELWVTKNGGSVHVPNALNLGRFLGKNEAELTVTSAHSYAQITATLTSEQMKEFENIRSGITTVDQMSKVRSNTAIIELEISGFSGLQKDILVAIGSKFIPWVSGTMEGAVELPPGKISNFFGFAHYRYVDRASVSRSDTARILLNILNAEQKSILAGLAEDVLPFTHSYINGRETLIRGYYPLRQGQSVEPESLVQSYAEIAGIAETQRGIIEILTFAFLESLLSEDQLLQLSHAR